MKALALYTAIYVSTSFYLHVCQDGIFSGGSLLWLVAKIPVLLFAVAFLRRAQVDA